MTENNMDDDYNTVKLRHKIDGEIETVEFVADLSELSDEEFIGEMERFGELIERGSANQWGDVAYRAHVQMQMRFITDLARRVLQS